MSDPGPSRLVAEAAAIGVTLDAVQARRLLDYERLLADAGSARGVISRRDVPRVRERHILDALRAATVPTPSTRTALDIGSGGGLPGIVVAIACPLLHVRLVEPRRNRAEFLESTIGDIRLENADVVSARVEDVTDRVELCFARALAPFERSWGLARPRLVPGGRLVYFAGASFDPAAVKRLPDRGPWEIRPAPPLASGGPLVIMSRP